MVVVEGAEGGGGGGGGGGEDEFNVDPRTPTTSGLLRAAYYERPLRSVPPCLTDVRVSG